MKRRRKARKSRRRAYNRGRRKSYNRRHGRRKSRRNRGGKYSSFVKAHKGLFKRMGFRAASRKIASMWRKKH